MLLKFYLPVSFLYRFYVIVKGNAVTTFFLSHVFEFLVRQRYGIFVILLKKWKLEVFVLKLFSLSPIRSLYIFLEKSRPCQYVVIEEVDDYVFDSCFSLSVLSFLG